MTLKHIALLLLIFLFVPTSIVCGDNINKDLQKQLELELKNKPLIIRNFYAGNTLKFSSDGNLISGGNPGIWTINGYFQPSKIKLLEKDLVISGRRLCWVYDYNKKGERFFRGTNTTIRIAHSPERNTLAGIMELLSKVFFTSDESLEDSVPSYWKELVQKKFILKDSANYGVFEIMNVNASVQGKLVSPRILHRVNPRYTEEARNLRLSGSMAVKVLITEEGKAVVQEILRPLGAGLDEIAIKTCETWKFSPALLNGSPVKFLTVIDFSFTIH